MTAPAFVPFAGVADPEALFTSNAELIRDDKRFYAIWLIDLVSHWARWRHPRCVAPYALGGELCTVARDARERAEHVGWVIESGEHGYRVVDYKPPARIYLVQPGPAVQDEPHVCDGQLTLVEGV